MLQLGEALAQDICADSLKIGLEPGEATRAISELAQHQHRPALAKQLHRMGQAAGVVIATFFVVSYFS